MRPSNIFGAGAGTLSPDFIRLASSNYRQMPTFWARHFVLMATYHEFPGQEVLKKNKSLGRNSVQNRPISLSAFDASVS